MGRDETSYSRAHDLRRKALLQLSVNEGNLHHIVLGIKVMLAVSLENFCGENVKC